MLAPALYRHLLYLYPDGFRREFAEEMACVFEEVHGAVPHKTWGAWLKFVLRELAGLICGALREHVRSSMGHDYIPFRRYKMQQQFRFPKATAILMSLILFGVVLAIMKATAIEVQYGRAAADVSPSLPIMVVFGLLVISAVVSIVLGVLFATKRSGVQRLANLQSWPEQK
jgi:hypothetical protein